MKNKKIILQSLSYVLVGAIQYVIDVGLFSLLLMSSDLPLEWNNIISRFSAALVGFVLNFSITFSDQVRSNERLHYFYRFLVLWFLLTLLSTLLISWLSVVSIERRFLFFSKITIEFILAFLAFIFSKYWVYFSNK